MPATGVMPRDALRQRLRTAIEEYLRTRGGKAAGSDAVREVSLEQDVDPSDVAAAMWALVDDGVAEYGSDADLTLP